MQTQEILHLPSTTSPTSESSSKARLSHACITGYAKTTPCSLTHAMVNQIVYVLFMSNRENDDCSLVVATREPILLIFASLARGGPSSAADLGCTIQVSLVHNHSTRKELLLPDLVLCAESVTIPISRWTQRLCHLATDLVVSLTA